jgi:hypothetical protein
MKKKQYDHKSFYMTPDDREMLDYLSKKFGINESAVIRKLMTEATAILKYQEIGERKND